MKAGGKRELFAEINITPLTDIFLVLLIIMMVVAPMLDTKGLKVAVPSVGPSSDTKTEPKIIKVEIDADGKYSIDNKSVGRMSLVAQMRAMKADHPDGVVLNTNTESKHEALTFAMDAAQLAGVTKLAVTASEAK